MQLKRDHRGFTLIELLVVIAIIGILSSIVLIALRGARDKAKDARIQASLAQVRALAEIVYDGDYNDLLTHADYTTLTTDITAQNGPNGVITDEQAADEYCVQSTLNVSGSWCVDSTGYAGATANCDATNYDCATD